MKIKRKMTIFLGLLGMAFLLHSFNPSIGLACDCVARPTGAALKNSSAVFSGKVIKIEYLDDQKQRNPEPRFIVTFKVSRAWKGVTSQEFVLHTIDNSWTCRGYYFRQDKEYLVFAYQNGVEDAKRFEPHILPEESFGVSLCGGTKLLSEARNDLEVLGEGSIPK